MKRYINSRKGTAMNNPSTLSFGKNRYNIFREFHRPMKLLKIER